jgi:phosphatidylglycerophosphatase C
MQTVSARAVIAALRERPSSAVVAFDCDGTVWSGDVGEDWFEHLLAREGLTPLASRALRAEAHAHGLSPAGDDRAVSIALLDAMNRGLVHEKRVFEIMSWASAGRTAHAERAMIDAMLDRAALPARAQGETLAVLREAERLGMTLVAVSASPLAVVRAALTRLSIRPHAVCAARQAADGDTLLPSLAAPIPYRDDKVNALRAAVSPLPPVAVALGDSAFDLELLSLAEIPLAVRPRPGLRERAGELVALRALEPE